MMQQQQVAGQFRQPDPQAHQQVQELQNQMKEMREQNLRLMSMLEQRSAKVQTQQHYTHDDLKEYFMRKKAGDNKLDAAISEEQARLRHLEALKAEAPASVPDSEMLVQLAESPDDTAALPLYNQHAEEARVEMENLQKRALEDMMGSDSSHIMED